MFQGQVSVIFVVSDCLRSVQINDRYEFPLQLDLDRENGKYLSPDADRSVRNLYTLHRLEHGQLFFHVFISFQGSYIFHDVDSLIFVLNVIHDYRYSSAY